MFPLLSRAGSSLYYCHILPDFFEKASIHSVKLYIGINISICSAFSTCVLLVIMFYVLLKYYFIMQLVHGAQFLKITSLLVLFTAAP